MSNKTSGYPSLAKLAEMADTHHCEVFYANRAMKAEFPNAYPRVGWYYWQCFPGCLPEGDPMGPFTSVTAALRHAYDSDYLGSN